MTRRHQQTAVSVLIACLALTPPAPASSYSGVANATSS